MNQQFETVKAPRIIIERCDGVLVVRATAEKRVVIRGTASATADEITATTLTVTAEGERIEMWVPALSQLLVKQVGGIAQIKGVEGNVEVQQADGGVVLRNLRNVMLGSVQGDISAREIDGRLQLTAASGDVGLRNVNDIIIERVDGDFGARNVRGTAVLKHAGGDASFNAVGGDITVAKGERDLYLQNVSGRVEATDIKGDVRLRGGLGGSKHTISASGDIVIRWPLDAPLNLDATAPVIVNRLPLQKVVEQTSGGNRILNGRLGDGATFLTVQSGGEVVIKPRYDAEDEAESGRFEFDFAAEMAGFGEQVMDIGEQIIGEINTRFSEQIGSLSTTIAGKVGADYAERAVRKAEEAVSKARRKTEEAARQTQPSPPPKAAEEAAPPSQQGDKSSAQIKILSMLEAGKITAEEANKLLQSLG